MAAERRGVRAATALAITAAVVVAAVLWLPVTLYEWVKAFHVIAVIAWMAGMLYLPRLFVYHTASAPGSQQSETFKVMERRLLRGIINPAMVATWALGLWLVWTSRFYDQGWFMVKFACVVGLTALHGFFAASTRAFAEDRNRHGQRFYRMINEVPTLLLIVIVIMVVVKPF